jgi:hypothetical protein
MTDAEIRPNTVCIGAGLRIVRWTVLVNGEAAASFNSRIEASEYANKLSNAPAPVSKEALLAKEGAG